MALINIRTVEDLKKVLLRQKLITRKAAEELGKIAAHENLQVVEGDSDEVKKDKTLTMIQAQTLLLEKYAKYPTLTEFNTMPNTSDQGIKWGATFGVALIVGELVLEQVRQIQGTFEKAMPLLYTVLLTELDAPRHKYMTQALEPVVKVELHTKDGVVLTPKQQQLYKQQLLQQLIEAFCLVSVQYGIMLPHRGRAYSLTTLGRRVMMHLSDAQKFIRLMADAHKGFQQEIPAKPKKEADPRKALKAKLQKIMKKHTRTPSR